MPTLNGNVKPGRSAVVYSEVETNRLNVPIPLPSVLKSWFHVTDGPKSSATSNPDEIAKQFPKLFGQPSAWLKAGGSLPNKSLNIGILLSGGQAPGGHNVIAGIFGGPLGILKCKYLMLTHDFVYPYRNQGGFDMICSGRDKIETPQQVAALRQTLKSVTNYIANVICKRADAGYNYGIILIPEGLIDFIPEVQQLIAELNEIIAHDVVDQGGAWKKKLRSKSRELFEILPKAIQIQLLLERDPHGNVQVSKIETEKMLIQMVQVELENRKKQGKYNKDFHGQPHFFGYEGRCGLPSNFDSNYSYALGYGAAALLHGGRTGLITSVANLGAPVKDWTVGGTPLTSLMDVERRHGKFKPVIKKAMVDLQGAPFKKFASIRDDWSLKNRYINPGPMQFVGPTSDVINNTLKLELGSQS
ncbi:hypothetical protein M8C21_011587 [Ambrosia artemisiifolia]|uniref:Pyrophosphate--fructose 6-phosphate 1-phosphotransferase subunit beta n=1 Tax=Ambrosia artemisiifolia TaxID=4212 RepID=A0AAD5GCQ8_AMBAR|nr:hypothetical protein M8C21_011587 [Ambrosia artemisiifolia]